RLLAQGGNWRSVFARGCSFGMAPQRAASGRLQSSRSSDVAIVLTAGTKVVSRRFGVAIIESVSSAGVQIRPLKLRMSLRVPVEDLDLGDFRTHAALPLQPFAGGDNPA